MESRHKFVYYDTNSVKNLRDLSKDYSPKIDSDEPIAIYIKTSGLPKKVNISAILSCDIIKMFHQHYFQLLIFSEIMNSISKNIDHVELNKRLQRVFRLCSCVAREKITNVKTLNRLLMESKKIYVNIYYEYLRQGKVDFSGRVPIPFVLIDQLIPAVKDAIGLEKYFSVIMELSKNASVYSCMALNDYISSRCNGYLSMNVLLSSDVNWPTYYSTNGQIIQNVHDYTEKDFRSVKTRSYRKKEY